MVYGHYYAQFAGKTFVIQAEDEAVENAATTCEILRGMEQLRRHGIRVLFVFGKGAQFADELKRDFDVAPHPETNRLIIPESALPRIERERMRVIRSVEEICRAGEIPIWVVPRSAIRVERRIGHGSTGVPAHCDLLDIQSALEREQIAVVGFGGEDDCGRFLHVPSVSLAAELAVALDAQKLLFLMHADGIHIPHPKKSTRQLSFADLEELLCLLQRQNQRCEFVLAGEVLPKVHASIRAVAGGVSQVHLVSYRRLLDEILTRTGVGTMIECRQSHHVDYARPDDLDEIERLHAESQQFRSACGTPYVAPLGRPELARLLPQTLLLQHRGVIIGKLHAVPVPGDPNMLQIGGFVIAENHQDSQQGQLLLTEAFVRLREQGYTRAVAISASPRAQGLFRQLGGSAAPAVNCSSPLAHRSLQRYVPQERQQVQWFAFRL
jgi:acetylglutamate kinase